LICVSIREPTTETCLNALKNLAFAEVRIDGMRATIEDMGKIFSQPLRLIATFRPEGPRVDMRKEFLLAAIDAGASYVDIEMESGNAYRKEIIEQERLKGCKVIISFHDFRKTPEAEELARIISRCFREGADIAKIACKVNSARDNVRLLNILDSDDFHGRTVVVGMGAQGRVTRVAAPLLGSPFTFASLSDEKKTAEGQIEKGKLEFILKVLKDE
jgi:3-dehydroquinate dehydratase type I